jgi:hypothetical protein
VHSHASRAHGACRCRARGAAPASSARGVAARRLCRRAWPMGKMEVSSRRRRLHRDLRWRARRARSWRRSVTRYHGGSEWS